MNYSDISAPLAQRCAVVGGGPVGCALAMLLARRGARVTIYERRPDIRRHDLPGGRSINLVLTERGLALLELLGLREEILELTTPVLGRMLHAEDGALKFQPYGKDDSECNYSISRGVLNEYMLDAAEKAGIELRFQKTCVGADFKAQTLELRDEATGGVETQHAEVIFGVDGAPSMIRRALQAAGHVDARVELLDYGYKELLFPAGPGGRRRMAGHALHLWARGSHFLMGLANIDGSFTGTAYLPREGPDSLASLDSTAKIRRFFAQHYPDAPALLTADFERQFLENPVGTLGTVWCAPYHLDHRALLVGDAAHGIVPFFGQGLNCGFEDCLVLDALMDAALTRPGLPTAQRRRAWVFAEFSARRKPNADAIAHMALDNFEEMRARVADPAFLLKKALEQRLEAAMPELYRSRYALVMYSRIPYAAALRLGELQFELLAELSRGLKDPAALDLGRARALIEARLVPRYEELGVDLSQL